jgi:hypothetical protein
MEGVSKPVYAPYHSFKAAHCVYENFYYSRKLRACPIPGGRFWHPVSNNPSPAKSSSSSNDLWDQLEDLSEQMNSIPDCSSSDVSSSSSDCLWDQLEDISDVLDGIDI